MLFIVLIILILIIYAVLKLTCFQQTYKKTTEKYTDEFNGSISIENIIYSNDHSEEFQDDVMNYLKNNLLYENVEFNRRILSRYLIVEYKLYGKSYIIVLQNLTNTYKDHREIIRGPEILYAKDTTNCSNITKKCLKYYGHAKNFHYHIPDAVSDITLLLGVDNTILYSNGQKIENKFII